MDRRQAMKALALGAAAVPLAPAGRLIGGIAVAHPHLEGAAAASPAAAAASATATPAGPFTLPALGYAFDALEPHLDAQTMEIHHDRHHAGYVANLNKAVAGRAEVEGWSVERLLRELSSVPGEIASAVRNHGGGHFNHSLLWPSLKRDGAKAPSGELAKAVDAQFKSFTALQEQFAAAASKVFGSGWAWLAWSPKDGLSVVTTPNQDCPLSDGVTPLLGIDVWEHAYYLKFQNRRADYIAAFAKVVDWDVVSARYREAVGG